MRRVVTDILLASAGMNRAFGLGLMGAAILFGARPSASQRQNDSQVAYDAPLTASSAAPSASGDSADTAAATDSLDLPADVDWIWRALRAGFYDSTMFDFGFTEEQRRTLAERARTARDRDEVAGDINAVLESFQLSHLGVFTRSDIEYYLFASMFSTHDASAPRVHHLGLQLDRASGAPVVRAAWDGLSADRAGLQRGDVILAVDGHPFHPIHSFASGGPATLEVSRDGTVLRLSVIPTHEGVNASLLRAMQKSAQILSVDNYKVGYVHLWSATCPEMLESFSDIILRDFRDAEGILLDLRDGWGGAWYEYLDPFFADRRDFFEFTVERRGKRTTSQPRPSEPHEWFQGPLVVLINEGTRSGKEALAFQFKKSHRGILVGTTTAGAFTGGTCRFHDGFVVYMPYTGPILLDGQRLEGVGVAPDVRIDDPVDRPTAGDPQLDGAIHEMRVLLDN